MSFGNLSTQYTNLRRLLNYTYKHEHNEESPLIKLRLLHLRESERQYDFE